MKLKTNKVFPVKLTVKEKHLNYLQSHFIKWFNDWANQSVIEEFDEEQAPQTPNMEYTVTIGGAPILTMKCSSGMLARYFPNRKLHESNYLTDSLVNELLLNFIIRLQPNTVSEAVICRDSVEINKSVHATFSIKSGTESLSMSFFSEVYGWYIQSLNLLSSNISNIDLPVAKEGKVYSNF